MALFRRSSTIQNPDPGTPEWWLVKLSDELANRQTNIDLMDRYYSGDHPLPFLTKAHESKMRSEFRLLLEDSRTNFMRLAIDSTLERLTVDGFRLSAQNDPVADADSWAIWQANNLDSDAGTAFLEAMVKGVSYVSVWAPQPGSEYPQICIEDPFETVVGYLPGSNFRRRAAALKVWFDDWTGMRCANVYMPDGIYKYVAPSDENNSSSLILAERPSWKPAEVDQYIKSPLGDVVTIVPLRNNPRLLWEGESDLQDVFRVQNQINAFLFLLALAGYFGAHRQRWLVGARIMEDDKTGMPVEPFDVAIDKLWQSENPESKFGEFAQTDLSGYLNAIEQKVTHIATLTKVPKHYLDPTGQEPSGDAIASAEAGLIKKVEKKQKPFGEGLEEAMRIARRFGGKPAAPPDSEIVWGAAQTESVATITDAAIKLYTAGVLPWEAILERLGCTQTEILRYAQMRMSDALTKALTEPENPDVDWKGSVTT